MPLYTTPPPLPGIRVIFNVVNFSKTKSLYRDGMSPVVKSTSRPKWCPYVPGPLVGPGRRRGREALPAPAGQGPAPLVPVRDSWQIRPPQGPSPLQEKAVL
ncbi:unnamed protein product [Gadus morhua 'NCC']